MRTSARIISVLALLLASASAQQRQVAFRTLCLEHVDDIRTIVLPGGGCSEGSEIPLYTDISPVVEASFSGSEVSFLLGKPGAGAKPAARGVLAKSKRQLFVFLPGDGKEESPPYALRCYDDEVGSFPMGHIRAINASPVPVRFHISGQLTPEIPAGKFAQFPHSRKLNDYLMYPVVVEFRSANGEWIKGQSVAWKATDRRREVVLTLVDPKFNQPTVRMYPDFAPWTGGGSEASR